MLKTSPPQVIVGTPGRLLDLVKRSILSLDKIKWFVIDECDDVLSKEHMRADVQQLFLKTPHEKQVMMFSATMNDPIKKICRSLMQDHIEVFIDEKQLSLDGIVQHYVNLEEK